MSNAALMVIIGNEKTDKNSDSLKCPLYKFIKRAIGTESYSILLLIELFFNSMGFLGFLFRKTMLLTTTVIITHNHEKFEKQEFYLTVIKSSTPLMKNPTLVTNFFL
jgi:hypothetical protein